MKIQGIMSQSTHAMPLYAPHRSKGTTTRFHGEKSGSSCESGGRMVFSCTAPWAGFSRIDLINDTRTARGDLVNTLQVSVTDQGSYAG